MNLLISYFYKVRFFTPDMIPLSTAVWDPKWYSNNGVPHLDKNGVLNGMRFSPFMPDKTCSHLCSGSEHCSQNPTTCAFLRRYKEMLDRLDYNKVVKLLEAISNGAKEKLRLGVEPTLVLMVYEAPTKPCSERVPLIAWFKEHGFELKEF